MIQFTCETKMHSVEMVVATRIRYNVDFVFVIVTLCLIFKDSLVEILLWAFEELKKIYL